MASHLSLDDTGSTWMFHRCLCQRVSIKETKVLKSCMKYFRIYKLTCIETQNWEKWEICFNCITFFCLAIQKYGNKSIKIYRKKSCDMYHICLSLSTWWTCMYLNTGILYYEFKCTFFQLWRETENVGNAGSIWKRRGREWKRVR